MSRDLFNDIPFRFDIDIEAFEKSGEPGKERRIGGFVTTEDLDQQGDRIIQEGLDFSHFLSKGWFNDNHSKDTAGIVGHPDIAELREKGGKKGWWVEGYLLKGTKRADDIWDLANALQKSGRSLGYSVEGKIQERTGPNDHIIAKAMVKNVAITNCPVNDRTSLEVLAKSLTQMEKALMAGTGAVGGLAGGVPHGEGVPGSGQALIPESLDGATPKKKKKKKKTAWLADQSVQGGLTKSAGIAFILTRHPNLSVNAAERIYEFAQTKLPRGQRGNGHDS
jgi:hypothetical protein